MIIPNSKIVLLKTPFEMSDTHQLTFSNATTQYNYFNSLPKIEEEECSYQRKDDTIYFPTGDNGLTYEDLLSYNYCMYQNTSYDDKWFYAYITKVEYDNDGMSKIEIKTDVFQTWQFDITYKRMFIEREHVNNDTIGLHTIHEGLETGEYVQVEKNESSAQVSNLSYLSNVLTVVGATAYPSPRGQEGHGSRPTSPTYNNVRSGLYYMIPQSANDLNSLIENVELTPDCEIYTIFMIPASILPNIIYVDYSYTDLDGSTINYKMSPVPNSSTYYGMGNAYINKPTTLDNTYTPRNKKLLTYPYQYLLISNNGGNVNTYRYEEFTSTNCVFNLKCALGVGCDIRLTPQNYRNGELIHTLSACKLPTCGWISDSYTNWLTQNAVNLKWETYGGAVSLVAGSIQMVGSLGSEGWDNLGQGFGAMFGQIKERLNHQRVPDEAKGGGNEGNLNFAEKLGFTYYKMSIKREYAIIIDQFFDLYGYQVNEVKLPNITGRQNWNYVKSIDCNIIGDIPQEDLNEIKTLFNRGITLWHNPSTFLDYSQSNNIV